ncbi:MAG: Hint domain-containing protein [Jannaschia sp.]
MLGACAQAQVISSHQVRVDGLVPSARDPFAEGKAFRWFGTPLRLDGARATLLLGRPEGQADLRRRVPAAIAKLSRSRGAIVPPAISGEPEHDATALILTDGSGRWQGHLVQTGSGETLLLFSDGLPPANTTLGILQPARVRPVQTKRNTICFTPGTRILTEDGPRAVEDLYPGDRVLTRDDGPQEILWMGLRHVSGARMFAMPHLRPVRIRSGALGHEEPEPDLIVSPGHQIMLTGPKARALWGEAEVLVRARDLIDDRRVTIDHGATDVTYIHLLFARHQILWANRVEVESFHPGDADLTHLNAAELDELLDIVPGVDADTGAYGAHARRCLNRAELAILRYEGAPSYLT